MAEEKSKGEVFVRIQSPNTIDITDKTVEEVADIQNFADEAGVDVEISNTSEGRTVARIIATAVVPKKK